MTDERRYELKKRYESVLERIERARERRGTGEPVTLLAASKIMPAEDIVYLAETCGLRLCGENHAQEFRDKYDAVSSTGCRMDFIGHLQTNKVKYVAGRAGLIHSLDSVRLAEAIQEQCVKTGTVQDVLVEINIGMEESKTGVSPSEFPRFMDELTAFDRLNVCGMMTMAPKCTENEEIRKYFRESYRIYLDFFGKTTHNIRERILSMGMSDSFETAIEEGATLVRVGSAIFGSRIVSAK